VLRGGEERCVRSASRRISAKFGAESGCFQHLLRQPAISRAAQGCAQTAGGERAALGHSARLVCRTNFGPSPPPPLPRAGK